MATRLEQQVDAIFEKLESMNKRLFRDNGNECMQSKINRHDRLLSSQEGRWKWVAGVSTLLLVSVLGKIIYDIVWC